MKKPYGVETGFPIPLSVNPYHEDCSASERTFKSSWTVVAGACSASILSAHLETRPVVRQLAPSNSNGAFGSASASITAAETTAKTLGKPNRLTEPPRPHRSEGTKTFLVLLEKFGPELVVKIVDAYREPSRNTL